MIKFFNKFINWLFKPTRTEVELEEKLFIYNYFNTCFKEYILNSRKCIKDSLIIKNPKLNFDLSKKPVSYNKINNRNNQPLNRTKRKH
jgi:hypothetical protein